MNEETRKSKYEKDSKKKDSWWGVIIAIVIIIALRVFVFELTHVYGESMLPTLNTGQTSFVYKLAYTFSPPRRGDIVTVKFDDEEYYLIKRIIGLPGETVEVKDGKFYIDGDNTLDTYGRESMNWDMPPVTVPDGYVFVVGDNRNFSKDSRVKGPIEIDHIIGRAEFVIWPLSDMKNLE